MFTTVVFDLDGTLLDTLHDIKYAGNIVCDRFGWPIHSIDEYRYFVGNGIPKLVERLMPPGISDSKTFTDAYKEFDRIYFEHMCDNTAPYQGIKPLIKYLYSKDVEMAVFSNKKDANTHSLILHYFDKSLFKIIRGSLSGVPPKPDKEGTLKLLYDMGFTLGDKNILYVGDSAVDVETAHNVDLPCCGALWGFRTQKELRDAGADFLAKDPSELKEIILGFRPL